MEKDCGTVGKARYGVHGMVTRTKATPLQEIYAITVRSESGRQETYRTTEEHPFWTVEEGWRKAGLLSEAYTLIDRTGAPVQIIHVEKETELQDVYNIEVDEHHTYHVGEIGIWVHNAKCCSVTSGVTSGGAANAASGALLRLDLQATQAANNVVDSLRATGHLPANYVTKSQAQASGWQPGKALNNYVPSGQMGGDIFMNSTNILPNAQGRVWFEADIGLSNTMSRSNQPGTRLLYSNDGLLYITTDHYKSVTNIGRWK